MKNPLICFYFQVHQPYRLRDLRVTDIGHGDGGYFDDEKNRAIFRKVAEKCYLPANKLMLELLKQYPDFRISYSLSGVFLDQCKEYGPDVLKSFRALAKTGQVEFLAETYYHSLSSVKSMHEFAEQVRKHVATIKRLFGQIPSVFRNTELIYRNELAHAARLMGFKGILAEGADHLLHGRNPNDPVVPPQFRTSRVLENAIAQHRPLRRRAKEIHVLLKNYRLSDDVAFRFSDKSWVGFPLNAETFTDWLTGSGGHCVNLFMDYETFGEHQWADTGIFDFLRALPAVWQERGIEAVRPSEVIERWTSINTSISPVLSPEPALSAAEGSRVSLRPSDSSQTYDVHNFTSWADTERDLSAWLGNGIQNAALESVYALEKDIKSSGDKNLLEDWRRLQTSDHFYYMSTKYWNDGDVHKYFSPYESPYEAYRRFSHALCDLRLRLEGLRTEELGLRAKKYSHPEVRSPNS